MTHRGNPLNDETSPLEELTREFRFLSSEWATRLAAMTSREDLQELTNRKVEELILQIHSLVEPSCSFPRHIQSFMASNLHRGPTLKDLSKHLGYSEKYCSDLFKQHMGETFTLYITRLRIQRAKTLLQSSSLRLSEISQSLGFSDQFAFSHFFKKTTGASPRSFRLQTSKK